MPLDYTDLTSAIQNYVEDFDTTFVSDIPVIVRQAEDRIYRDIRLPALRKNQTGTTTSGNKYLTMPTDFLAVYDIMVTAASNTVHLINKDVSYLYEAYPGSTTGVPRFYGIFDDTTFLLAPTPDNNYPAEIHYYFKPESITTVVSGETWLGQNAEAVLLSACILEAYIYMKGEPDLLDRYEMRYKEALNSLGILGEGWNRKDVYRSGERRIPT